MAIPLVDTIRERVRQWRADGWPGTTAVTLALLQHWWDADKVSRRQYPFYFCQLEAIETLIWHLEALPEYRQGIYIQGDGGDFERLCNKMATGSGKTTVMAMIITWQVLNALTYPKSPRKYSSAIFLVAPGLTVKSRLQVLMPGHEQNYYDLFELCPSEALRQKLNRADILIENWHTLMPLKEQERSVVKKGKESDEAYTRRVLGPLANAKNLVVINDEAHHAYRKPADIKVSRAEAEAFGIDLDEATRWVEGLDRIHKTRRIARCYDLSATPFAPTGRSNTEAGLFSWVVSDFGLNDAIEAGLVKTPRVVVRDDALPNAQTLRPKLYHLYREPDVAEDLNRQGRSPRTPARAGAAGLYAAGGRLACHGGRLGGAGAPLTAGDADGMQPHRNRSTGGALFHQGPCAVGRAARCSAHAAGGFQSAGKSRAGRSCVSGQRL
ncbi:MAG: DEAD/DEAH box helicase family protein [Ottowia sp.]